MQQFAQNLQEAGLVRNTKSCLRPDAEYNNMSQEHELVLGVLTAGLYPNLIQVVCLPDSKSIMMFHCCFFSIVLGIYLINLLFIEVTLCVQIKRGTVTNSKFRPNDLSFHTRRGHVILHSSSINR